MATKERNEAYKTDASKPLIQRVTLPLMLLSLGILIAAMTWTWRIGQQSNLYEHRLYHVVEDLIGIRKNVEKMEQRLAAQTALAAKREVAP